MTRIPQCPAAAAIDGRLARSACAPNPGRGGRPLTAASGSMIAGGRAQLWFFPALDLSRTPQKPTER